MTELDKKINRQIMEETGLEENSSNFIVDQDTGVQYQMRGKNIVSPGNRRNFADKRTIEFDPINNTRMMNYIFSEFIDKLQDEDTIPPVSNFCTINSGTDMHVAKLLMADGSTIQSAPYKNETTCYTDLVFRLNGDSDIDLSEYDIDRRRKPRV